MMDLEIAMSANVDYVFEVSELKSMQAEVEMAQREHISKLHDVLENLKERDKYMMYAEYASREGGDTFFSMGTLDDFMGNASFSEAFRMIDSKNFSLNDEGFWYDGSGELISGSMSDFLSEKYYAADITEWLERNGYDVCVPDSAFADWKNTKDEYEARIDELENRIDELKAA